MIGVSTQTTAFAVIYIYEQRAAVGTIQRTDGMSDLRHTLDYSYRASKVQKLLGTCIRAATSFILRLVLKGRLLSGFRDRAGGLWVYNRSEELRMRCLIPSVLFLSLTGVVFAQGHQGGQGQSWSLGGFGSVVYPGMGHAPGATPAPGQFGA